MIYIYDQNNNLIGNLPIAIDKFKKDECSFWNKGYKVLCEEMLTQQQFMELKKNIENEMATLNITIKSKDELGLNAEDENLRMTELRSKLNYVESKILIKV